MNTPQWLQDHADGHVFFRGHPPDGSAASKQWLLECVEWADMELGWKMSADETRRVSASHERIYMLPRCKDGCAQCAPDEIRPQQESDQELALPDSTMRCKRNLWVAVEPGAVTLLEDGPSSRRARSRCSSLALHL